MIKKLFILQIILIIAFLLFMFHEELGFFRTMNMHSESLPMQHMDAQMPSTSFGVPDPTPVDPLISISLPQVREVWEGGKTYIISWNSDKKDPVKIEACTSLSVAPEHRKCITIAENLPDSGSYSYLVPSGKGSDAIINIALSTATSRQSFVLVDIRNSSLFQELGLDTH